MNMLIGIAGKPRNGKDSIAKRLVEKHGFRHYSFADYLKWVSMEYFGFDKEVLWGPKTKESRLFLQQLGKYLTDLDSDILIKKVIEKIKLDYKKSVEENTEFRAVISDVRREEETSLFKRESTAFLVYDDIMNSGVSLKNAFDKLLLLKVERSLGLVLKEEPGIEECMNHPIEQLTNLYDDWDYLISNDKSIEDLNASVDRLVSELEEGSYNDSNQG